MCLKILRRLHEKYTLIFGSLYTLIHIYRKWKSVVNVPIPVDISVTYELMHKCILGNENLHVDNVRTVQNDVTFSMHICNFIWLKRKALLPSLTV